MTHYEKIRAALEVAREYMQESLNNERAAYKGHESISNIGEMNADIVRNRNALAALAELEKAAREPVAWMWNDELGIPHASAGSKKPVWLESSASAEYIKQANLRPLYTTPPAPVAEIREPTPEECERIYAFWLSAEGCNGRTPGERMGGLMFNAVRAVMWPKSEGL